MAQLKSTEDFLKEVGVAPVKAEDLQKKFDEATKAEYDQQRTELQNTENKFYNKLYDTQQTTMDTIRQNNAAAVATGASRGIQAANELSTLLGLQQESVEGATDIANQATTLAQDETQAMLENVLTADTQAREANQNLANILMQRESVGVEQQNANTAAIQALGQLEAQARADGNTALAAFYRNTMETLKGGIAPNNAASSDNANDTDTPPAKDAEQRQEDIKEDLANSGIVSEEAQETLSGLPAGNWGTGNYDTYDNLIKYAQTEGSGDFKTAWNNSVQQGLAGLLNTDPTNITVDTQTAYAHQSGNYALTKISIPRNKMTDAQYNALKSAGSYRVKLTDNGIVNIQIYAYKDAATNKKYGGNFTFSAVAKVLGG